MRDEAEAHHQRLAKLFQDAGATNASITFSRLDGDVLAALRREAPVHDAIMFLRPQADSETRLAMPEYIKDALEECGRPLLLLSCMPTSSLTRKIAIAWNGSAEGGRAVSAAIPLLKRASDVVIITLETAKTESGEAARLSFWFARPSRRRSSQS